MKETELLQQIDEFIAQNEKNILRDLAELISHKSVKGPAEDGAPYGRGPRNALDCILAQAQRLGFAVNDGDGYVGWAELPGQKKDYLGVISHVDVVPEGEGWIADPYTMTEKDGWLIARGVCDNKGAAILSLYAAYFIAQHDIPLRYGLRVMFGCDEESCMHDVPYYLEHNPEPLFCFTPDVDFPVSIGEKGIHSNGGFYSAPVFKNISEFSGGNASNSIPGNASCVVNVRGKDFKPMKGITVSEREDGTYLVEAQGIGGHAAHPDGKLNAIGILVDFLLENDVCDAEERKFLELMHKIHVSGYGEGLGIACEGKLLGRLTSIGGIISQDGGVLRQDMNIRFPECISGAEITAALSKIAAEHDASFEPVEVLEPFYISPDYTPIQTLARAYSDISGHDGKPYTLFGGTYARRFKNAVGFGPGDDFTQRPSYLASDHAPNESSYFPTLKEALKIFIVALIRLEELPPSAYVRAE